jgi:hypothetical protein
MKLGEKHRGCRRSFRYRRNTSASALPGTGPGERPPILRMHESSLHESAGNIRICHDQDRGQ